MFLALTTTLIGHIDEHVGCTLLTFMVHTPCCIMLLFYSEPSSWDTGLLRAGMHVHASTLLLILRAGVPSRSSAYRAFYTILYTGREREARFPSLNGESVRPQCRVHSTLVSTAVTIVFFVKRGVVQPPPYLLQPTLLVCSAVEIDCISLVTATRGRRGLQTDIIITSMFAIGEGNYHWLIDWVCGRNRSQEYCFVA